MISQGSKFKVIKRGFKDSLVLIPGWGTDYRIFDNLGLDYNYIVTLRINLVDFNEMLLKFLEAESMKKVSLFGWSLGGYLAACFAVKNVSRVEGLNLVSVKEKFDPLVLAEVRQQLKKSKRSYLYKFYQAFFSPDEKEAYLWFKNSLLKKYLNEMKLGDLLSGLDYLENASLVAQDLSVMKKINIFHGKEDKIAPFSQALKIKRKLSNARFVFFSNTGHAPFLSPQFRNKFANG